MAKLTFTEALRAAVQNAPVTRYQIAKDTGISQANLSRLVHGTRGLSMENLDILCTYLDLELVPKQSKKR